jgi:diguanylate cyclase (GGDEF)-like protein
VTLLALRHASGALHLAAFLWPALALLAGGLGGFLLGRRRPPPPQRWEPASLDRTQRFLPDPAIQWLGRAHDARVVWAIEGTDPELMTIARHLAGAGISIADLEVLERKLISLVGREDEGVERVGSGTLLFVSRPAAVAGMLLPAGPDVGMDLALDDLRSLANALVYHHVLLPTRETKSPVESLASVGTGLAVQIERLTGASVAVVANLHGGPQVIAVSPTGDRRLLNVRTDVESPAGRVARGEADILFTGFDPLGSSVVDRRRSTAAQVIPLGPDSGRLGAVVVWPRHGNELAGQVLADITEATRSVQNSLDAARQLHELRLTATTDPLTGLTNRRGLEEAMARIAGERGALIYADLDKFKVLNDSLGHPAGDDALKHFADIIRRHVRTTDTAARIGGEEFAIWLPGATAGLGSDIADRIRQSLMEGLWVWRDSRWPLTASFGVAACPETSRSRQNLPAQADAALYQAKNGGRNRVVVAGKSGEW